jgi:hypothetical protein
VQTLVEYAIKQDVQNARERDLLFDNPVGKETYITNASSSSMTWRMEQ